MKPLVIIKVGGNILDHPELLQSFIRDFARIPGQKILVHGGGKIATSIGDKLGIISKYEGGRRITDAATLELVTMVYAGLINKQLVAKLQAHQCNALGLCGADANIILASKRPVNSIDYGFVGDIAEEGVDANTIKGLLDLDLSLVIAPLTHNGNGDLLNTNADTIAGELARALCVHREVRLIYCFEKRGVLSNPDEDTSVIPQIDQKLFLQLMADGSVQKGMIPKLNNALQARHHGVQHISIGHAEDLQDMMIGEKGTKIL